VKTALVLSAGGMFGAYQAGVWQALQPVFRPDLVVGCSVGSINGWAIAAGVSGEELARTWLDPRCATLMSPRRPRRPWPPLFDPGPLEEMIQELTATYRPQVPFALAVTELPRLRLRILEGPELTWRHILASCAVPLGFPPVRIDGRKYCDGGLLNVMPVWAAERLGAERAIAVNALPSMPLNVLRAGVRMVRWLAPREPRVSRLQVIGLGPERALGTLREALTWEPERIRRWIERGRRDAEALLAGPEFAATPGRFV
jgi:NTE family protein